MKSFREFLEEKDYLKGNLFSIMDKLEKQLPENLERNIAGFVGVESKTLKRLKRGEDVKDWGIMDSYSIESYIKNNGNSEYQKYLKPALDYIRNNYGDTITLYRFQNISNPDKKRIVLSWTLNKDFAKYLSKYYRKKYLVMSDDDIEKAYTNLMTKGIAKAYGHTYIKKSDKFFYIYKKREFITDGYIDRFIKDLKDMTYDIIKLNSRRNDGVLYQKEVKLKDIVWITNRANQQEFIVINDGDYGKDISNEII